MSKKAHVKGRPPARLKRVDPSLYDDHYYLTNNEGGALFAKHHGRKVTPRMDMMLHLAKIQKGDVVLDVGCGRGEIVIQSVLRGASYAIGIDYAASAIKMCGRAKKVYPEKMQQHLAFYHTSADAFRTSRHFDKIFFLDVYEHLYPHEVNKTLKNMRRWLKPNGVLIIHTAPNLTFYRSGYRLLRLLYPVLRHVPPVRRLVQTKPNWQGRALPKDPEEGQDYNKKVHVNEQTPESMKRTLEENGFSARIRPIPFLRMVRSPLLRALYLLLSLPPWNKYLCAELIAYCTPTPDGGKGGRHA